MNACVFSVRFLCRMAVLMICAGTAAGWAQKRPRPDPVKLDETMAWLNNAIAKNAGFDLIKPPGQETTNPVRERLLYQVNDADVCHLNWRTVATGDEDMKNLYPGLNQDEDLAAIASGSIHEQPLDVHDLLDGGNGQLAESSGAGADSRLYWRLTGNYSDETRDQIEPFGFLFEEMTTAQHFATVLEHGVNLCHASHAPEQETDVGCDFSPTRQVINDESKKPGYVAFENMGSFTFFQGHYVNRSQKQVSCVAEFVFYGPNKTWNQNVFVTFDLTPGQTADGSMGMPLELGHGMGSMNYQCFPQGAVNVNQNSCAELRHPLHWDPKKPKTAAKP